MSESVWQYVRGRRDRFMRDPVPVRLGNLASTLARIASSATHPSRHDLVYRCLTEAEYFIGCTGPETDPSIQPDLVAIQLNLALWRRRWTDSPEQELRSLVSDQCRLYSRQVLDLSGLLR